MSDSLVIACAHLTAGFVCLFAARSARAWSTAPGDGRVWQLWLAIAALLAGLALARGIHFSGWLDGLARQFLWAKGWYYDRRPYQRAIVAALLIGSFGAALALIVLRHRHGLPRSLTLGCVGAVGLVAYLLVRAVSYHNIDSLLYRRSLEDVEFSLVFEFLGAAFIAASAAGTLVGRDVEPRPPPG